MYAEEFKHSGCELGEKLRPVVGQEGGRASLVKNVAVRQDVVGAFGSEFDCNDSEHVRMAAETIREEEDVNVSSSRGWQRPKVVDADKDAGESGWRR